MMRCLLGCFRVAGADGGGGGREVKGNADGHGQLVAPSLARMTNHQVVAGKRARQPSRNALAAVFLREDESSRVEVTASSWVGQDEDRKMYQDLKHEDDPVRIHPVSCRGLFLLGPGSVRVAQTIMQESCGSSLETTNEPQGVMEDEDSVHQTECGPSLFDNVHFMEAPNAEDCDTPSRFHQSSSVPDTMSSSKVNEEMQTTATSNATDLEGFTKDNSTEAFVQNEYHVLDPAEHYEKCGVSKPREDFIQLDQPAQDPNCKENENLVSIITVSEECSLFQSSEGSVSSLNKISGSTNTTSMEKSVNTEVTTHSTSKKVLKNHDSELEFPSLSQWLKPPNPKKSFRDEALTSDRSAKLSDEDRPIIGMVAAHWKDEEPEKFTPKWWDGNGIPNSTNKYKEDQKVSWHAMSFEERLEKALSEEKLLSERNCFSGKTSHILGMEGEESDTAESIHMHNLCSPRVTEAQ